MIEEAAATTYKCRDCKELLPAVNFYCDPPRKDSRCIDCNRKHSRAFRAKNRYMHIFYTTRWNDAKRGLENDMDRDFVRALIQNPCSYCGCTGPIGMDRRDSGKGHTKDNVVPCCVRCNFMKSSMPKEAWDFLVPSIKAAYEKGLFKDWRSRGTCGFGRPV